MSHYVPAIESRARLETASERDSLQSGVLPQACDWAKDWANESAPASERNAIRNARTRAIAGILRVELAGLAPATSWVRSRRSPALSFACFQGFRGGGGPA
jgi:hypothetical protein